jgi:hypothetical protein
MDIPKNSVKFVTRTVSSSHIVERVSTMRSRKIFVLLALVGAFTVPAGFPAFGTQYNPTYGPSPSNLYFDFGCTAGSLVADWPLTGSGGGAGTTFADASGNGNTATLYGSDTVTSTTALGYPAAPVGGGIYFNGLSGAGNYLGVPYNAAFSGMDNLTLTAWVYFPSGFTISNETAAGKREIFSLWNQSGGTQCYQLGFGFENSGSISWLAFQAPGQGYDTHYWNTGGTPPGPHATPGSWQLISVSYAGGTGTATAVGLWDMMENGIATIGGQLNVGSGNAQRPIPTAAANQILKLAGGDNEWIGGLADLAIWNSALSPTDSTGPTYYTPTEGLTAGELGALYNTPMSGISALAGYNAVAMNQLFTLYANASPSATAPVTTANGTLTWQYVASGLPGASGSVGTLGNGADYVNLDDSGGGIETVVVPEPAMLTLVASGVLGLLAYAWRKRK